MDTKQLCPFCHYPIVETFYFCSNCGRNLKHVSVSISLVKQICIYSLSILAPPLGLWPGIKYLKQSDEKAKIVSLVAIILTVVSTVITIWLTMSFVNQINQSVTGQINLSQ